VIDGETGVPIARAGVSFALVRKDATRVPGFVMPTDERGEFNFGGFAPGHYSVSVSSEYYGGNFYSDPVYFDVTDQDVTKIEVKTTSGLSVSGVVVAEGMPTNELIKLLPSLTVSVSGTSKSDNQVRTGGRGLVAPDGSFQVEGLKPGPVSIFISTQRPPFARPMVTRIEREGVQVSENFDIQQSVSGLRVVIDYGTGVIRGTVKFDGETAIGDARIYVTCRREGARDGPGAQVDARGNFLITNLGEGAYEVTLQVNNLSPHPPRPTPPQKQIVKVTNGSESEVNFVVDLTPKP